MELSFLLGFLPFLLLLSIVVFLDGSRRADSVVKGRVLHTLDDSLPAGIHFLWIVAPKRGRNGWAVIHPALQFELPNDLAFPVGFGPALGDLVAPDVGFIEIMDKVDGELDQEVALGLGVIGVVEPVVEISLGSKP